MKDTMDNMIKCTAGFDGKDVQCKVICFHYLRNVVLLISV